MLLITNLLWIDQNVQNEDNRAFINQIKKKYEIDVTTFTESKSCLDYIQKKIKFKLFIIIVSGRLFPSYLEELNQHINDLSSIPISIIFTFDKNKYKDICSCKDKIEDVFYNPGGVVDSFEEISKFLE